jgi:hypothetical protein
MPAVDLILSIVDPANGLSGETAGESVDLVNNAEIGSTEKRTTHSWRGGR